MNIFNFPVPKPGCTTNSELPEMREISTLGFHLIDLDYIVSISPVYSTEFFSHGISSISFAYFDIHIKLGQPIRIQYNSTTYTSICPDNIVQNLKNERQKLIDAWMKVGTNVRT